MPASMRRLRGVQERGRPGRRPLPRSRHPARVHRGEELLLPALGLPGPPARPVQRAARFRPAEVPLQRGPQLHRGRPPGLRVAAPASRGRADPLGRGAGHLCLGRRAHQLPQRAHVRARRGNLREAFWPHAHHVLGKDILRFHCVFWPALLLSAGYGCRSSCSSTAGCCWTSGISKSSGNTVDPLELVETYGADAVRFWELRSVSFGQDGNASLDGLHERYERELANDLGNLVSRTTAMIARYREGRIAPGRPNEELGGLLDRLRVKLVERFDAWELTAALEDVWELVRWLNRHVEQTVPWELAKNEAKAEARRGSVRPRRRPARGRCRPLAVPARDGAADPRRAPPAGRPFPGADRVRQDGRDRRDRGGSPLPRWTS